MELCNIFGDALLAASEGTVAQVHARVLIDTGYNLSHVAQVTVIRHLITRHTYCLLGEDT